MIDPGLSFVFPGQGSQSTGMLAELEAGHAVVRQTFSEASDSLGYDIWELIQNNPGDALNQTQNTQPALLSCSVALWRLWCEHGGTEPVLMAGHSLGEYSALVCAGALSFKDAVTLVSDRGKYMQESVPAGTGAMAAILGLSDEQVIQVCKDVQEDEVVSAANFNSDGQVVIAGHKQAVDRAIVLAKDRGAKRAMPLAVSVPSHCALMMDAADRFAKRLQTVTFSDATIPVVQNVDAESRSDAEAIKQALVEQLHQPVHWWKSVHKLRDSGVTAVIECGPGKVLGGLIKRIDRSLEVYALHDSVSLESALTRGGS